MQDKKYSGLKRLFLDQNSLNMKNKVDKIQILISYRPLTNKQSIHMFFSGLVEDLPDSRSEFVFCVWQVINGLLERPDWEEAIRTPLGILPGGSGNALAASVHHYSRWDADRLRKKNRLLFLSQLMFWCCRFWWLVYETHWELSTVSYLLLLSAWALCVLVFYSLVVVLL